MTIVTGPLIPHAIWTDCIARYEFSEGVHHPPIKGSFGLYGPGAFVQHVTRENRALAMDTLGALEVRHDCKGSIAYNLFAID